MALMHFNNFSFYLMRSKETFVYGKWIGNVYVIIFGFSSALKFNCSIFFTNNDCKSLNGKWEKWNIIGQSPILIIQL